MTSQITIKVLEDPKNSPRTKMKRSDPFLPIFGIDLTGVCPQMEP